MRTTKPISTISYNSPTYLALKLDELTKAGVLSFWAFIPHKPEDDEAGNKPHIHVYIEPAKMVQTDDIKKEFAELDLSHPDKPLSCISFRPSKFADWYLYGRHNKPYLASKMQSRIHTYAHEEFVTSDADDLTCKARSIEVIDKGPYAAMNEAISLGWTWAEFLNSGQVPIQLLNQYEKAWWLLVNNHTQRNDRSGHDTEL